MKIEAEPQTHPDTKRESSRIFFLAVGGFGSNGVFLMIKIDQDPHQADKQGCETSHASTLCLDTTL